MNELESDRLLSCDCGRKPLLYKIIGMETMYYECCGKMGSFPPVKTEEEARKDWNKNENRIDSPTRKKYDERQREINNARLAWQDWERTADHERTRAVLAEIEVKRLREELVNIRKAFLTIIDELDTERDAEAYLCGYVYADLVRERLRKL
jgi:hypothetical protein